MYANAAQCALDSGSLPACSPAHTLPPARTCKLWEARRRALLYIHAALDELRCLHAHTPRRWQRNFHRLFLGCCGAGRGGRRCRACLQLLILLLIAVVVEAAAVKQLLR